MSIDATAGLSVSSLHLSIDEVFEILLPNFRLLKQSFVQNNMFFAVFIQRDE